MFTDVPEHVDMGRFDKDLEMIVKRYVDVMNKLSEVAIPAQEWSQLDRMIVDDEVEFTKAYAEEHDIFNKISSAYSEFISSRRSSILGRHLAEFWEHFWLALLEKADENQVSREEASKNISSWRADTNEGLLTRIKQNEDEAAEYLALASGFSNPVLDIKKIPPFTAIDTWDMRIQFEHQLDENWDADEHLLAFYKSPGYLKFNAGSYEELVELCFKATSDDFNKSRSIELREMTLAQEDISARVRYSSEMIKRRIQDLEWSPSRYYVNPSEDSVTTVQELTDKLHRDCIVQLLGIGGLGKTALAYKYILDNLEGDMEFTGNDPPEHIPPYEAVFFLSSKDWPQGEYDSVDLRKSPDLPKDHPDSRENPQNPRITAATHHLNGRFEFFVREVANYLHRSRYSSKTLEDAAFEFINENRVLVVLDNFEDVQAGGNQNENEELQRYADFFDRFSGGMVGRIIITTRTQFDSLSSRPFRLKEVSKKARFELMKNRFRYLAQEHSIPATKRVLDFLTSGEGRAGRTAAFNELAEELGPDFEKNLGYPHVIFMFTRELMDAAEDYPTIQDAIRAIAKGEDDEGLSFSKFVENQWEWSIQKSFTSVKKDKACMSILEELWKKERGMIVEELYDALRPLSIQDIKQAMNKLVVHDVFLDKNTPVGASGPSHFADTDSFRLKLGARYILGRQDEFKQLGIDSTDEPMTNSQKEDLSLLRKLDDAQRNGDIAKTATILGKLQSDKRVRIGNRKPVNQSIVLFALSILDNLLNMIEGEGDK